MAISPEVFAPPSETVSIFAFSASSAHSNTADNCGYPTPVTFDVIHAEPDPMPILTASTPQSASIWTPSGVTMFPAITPVAGYFFLNWVRIL